MPIITDAWGFVLVGAVTVLFLGYLFLEARAAAKHDYDENSFGDDDAD